MARSEQKYFRTKFLDQSGVAFREDGGRFQQNEISAQMGHFN
jgi:hypothetical protein